MKYLPSDTYNTQSHINQISTWTSENLMKLNETKCNYMIFSRTKENFATRLNVNGKSLERVAVTKLLGVWISEDLSWSRNCQEICQRAYSRLWMLRNLKKHGASRTDLVDVYTKQCRSILELAVPVWNSSIRDKSN